LQTGPSQMIDYVVQNPTFTVFSNYIGGVPHGDPHLLLGGDPGSMGTMFSPDDPVFYLHHSNIDRFYAIWQDCYDYDQVPPDEIYDDIIPSTWTVYLGKNAVTYNIDGPMPYFYQSFNATTLSFATQPTPLDMNFIGDENGLGFGGMYYRYGPDVIVNTINNSPILSGVCTWDTLANYPLPTTKRSLQDSEQQQPQPQPQAQNLQKFLLGSNDVEQTLAEINQKFARHTQKQKIHYLALWECSNQKKDKNRNYSIPLNWLAMNGHTLNDWQTTCEREGWLNGYQEFALLKDAEYSVGTAAINWGIFAGFMVVFLVLVGIAVGYAHYRQRHINFDRIEDGGYVLT